MPERKPPKFIILNGLISVYEFVCFSGLVLPVLFFKNWFQIKGKCGILCLLTKDAKGKDEL